MKNEYFNTDRKNMKNGSHLMIGEMLKGPSVQRKMIQFLLLPFFFVLALNGLAQESGDSYYLSSSEGSDEYDGSLGTPWASLEKISSVALGPGDSVFFKRGDRFDGHFILTGSGEEGNPIVIIAYGEGTQPIITGEAGEENGGDYQEAIYIENNDNITFEGLEVNNERIYTRAGIDDVDAYGVYIFNSGDRILRNFTFRNMTFRNVFAVKEMNDPDDFNGLEVAAVRIESARNTVAGKEKNIQDVLVEDCYFENLQRLGVHMKHQGGNAGIGNDSINRNMNLVFRNNEFHNTGGTCILPTNTYNVLIEHNLFDRPGSDSDPRMPARGSSVWTWRCRNTVIQYNQCLHIRGYLDSHGIHIDHENRNTFVQYNYMEDCEGGFVEILGGNVNAVYRFNISVNDGWRKNPNWINSNHTLWINEKGPGGTIEYCDSSYIYNNIFYAINGGNIGGQQVVVNNNGTPLFMTNNLYMGTVAEKFRNMDKNPLLGEPNFVDGGSEEPDGYRLMYPSLAMNVGIAKRGPVIPGAGRGIFQHISPYPDVDFFGNPVDLSSGTPNAGACSAKEGNVHSPEQIKNFIRSRKYMAYPNPARDKIILKSFDEVEEITSLKIIDLSGRTVQHLEERSWSGEKTLSINLTNDLPVGNYIIKINNTHSFHFVKASL